jgi:nitrite reductase (NADH) small subunit
MDWTTVAVAADVPPGQARVVHFAGEEVAVLNVDGTFYACSERCPHAGGPLHQGFVKGTRVSCPWHGWVFDLCPAEPALRDGIVRYSVRVEDGQLQLAMPEPASAA